MKPPIAFSSDFLPIDWSESDGLALAFGEKGAKLAVLPRAWTPPFALISSSVLDDLSDSLPAEFNESTLQRLESLGTRTGKIIIRSSVLGETIWDRGTYESEVVDLGEGIFANLFLQTAKSVLASAPGKNSALIVQEYISPRAGGEFGNLLRISRTRDHWEVSTATADGATARVRFNTQRDTAADPSAPLVTRGGISQERSFGEIGAWLNNELLRGRPQRLNCEWVTDNRFLYVVQIDEETEDFFGINPLQLRIAKCPSQATANCTLLRQADDDARKTWDKLSVLQELWEGDARHKPMLCFVSLSALDSYNSCDLLKVLAADFQAQFGNQGIVVRTSGLSGVPKVPNLPRTECMTPTSAARWCLDNLATFKNEGENLASIAYVAHRFIGARAGAWVRVEPDNAVVEIHALWGLPDALQYCAYDTWEVHLPTGNATEHADYKSHMLLSKDDGSWEYVRVKNELARKLSIGRLDAVELAKRSQVIASRLERACHIMWFVGCFDAEGTEFNMPWYWTEAHDTDRNTDRSNYQTRIVTDHKSLEQFRQSSGSNHRLAIELKPDDLNLMRDLKFIEAVGNVAVGKGVPVILNGSTLAHAYFVLRRTNATIVTRGERNHSRVRRSSHFGKLVRDKIPARIASKKEVEVTRKVPKEVVKGFLFGKLIEEALEIRSAAKSEDKILEFADLYEVFRAIASLENISLETIANTADQKRSKAGGFDQGLVLLQTAILGRARTDIKGNRQLTQVLAKLSGQNLVEIPFSFFGFMEINKPRSIYFEALEMALRVTLQKDRIQIEIIERAEQLELPLDLTAEQFGSI